MRLPMLEPLFLALCVSESAESDVPAPLFALWLSDSPESNVPDALELAPSWSNLTTPRCLSKLAFLIVTVTLLAFSPCSFATASSIVTM